MAVSSESTLMPQFQFMLTVVLNIICSALQFKRVSLCPTQCTCSNSTSGVSMNCYYSELTSIPSEFPSDLYNILQFLLTIFRFTVTIIQLNVVSSCPESCTCTNETCTSWIYNYVDCSSSGLTSIPSDFPIDSTYINLGRNDFTIVETGSFQNYSILNSIDLPYCKINVIQPGAFAFLPSLGYLNLQHNYIRTIPASIFVGLDNIYQINLNYNNISTLSRQSIAGLRGLDTISLQHNKVKKIDSAAFVDFPELNYLDLQSNEITMIENVTFQNLSRLYGLYLENNKISEIQPNSFAQMTFLNVLKLTNNKFIDVKQDYFSSLPNIGELWMDKNNISYIEPGTFHSMPTLYVLALDLYCDCSIIPFWNWLTFVGKYESTITCSDRNGAFLASLPTCAFDQCINETMCPINFCSNGGTCYANSVGDPSCLCSGDWTGTKCNVNPCHNNPCGINGVCEVNVDDKAECQCRGNWTGIFCEKSPCESRMCNQSMCYYNDTGASVCLSTLNFQCTENTAGGNYYEFFLYFLKWFILLCK